MLLSNCYVDMQGLFEAINRHSAAAEMRINASKSKEIPVIIPGELRQTFLLDGEALKNVQVSSSTF